LLIGAGKMAEIAAHTLAEHAVGAVRVLNRDPERAAAVAAAIGGDWCGWEQLPDALAWADVVITSTGAPHTLIHAQTVAETLPQRAARPLLIIDLAVPRDVDRAVGDLPGVQLADIDDLYTAISAGLQRREDAVPAARRIIAQEVSRYAERMAALDVAPTIADLRDRAEQIRLGEVQKALRKLGALSAQEQRAVEALSVAIVNKLLHGPTVELKRHAADTRFTQTTRALFGLEADVE
jgi:glutamyl-tRNA reductase